MKERKNRCTIHTDALRSALSRRAQSSGATESPAEVFWWSYQSVWSSGAAGAAWGNAQLLSSRSGLTTEFSDITGPWDAQRANGKFYPEFRDFANVAIGLYAGAAGLTANQVNMVADVYAASAGSRYQDALDPVFTNLAERNVVSVELGVTLQRNADICTPAP